MDTPLPPECQVPEDYDDRCDWCRKMGVHPHSGCTHLLESKPFFRITGTITEVE